MNDSEIDNYNKIELEYLLKNLNINENREEISWATSAKKHFERFYEEVREHPLSSFIRAIEIKCRELECKEFEHDDESELVFHWSFEIRWEYDEDANCGSCFLTEDAGIFVILIPSRLKGKEIETRKLVAHEIGHLYSALVSLEIKHFNGKVILAKPDECREFLLDCLDLEKDLDKRRRDMYNNRANIIGVFALNERSRFYNHRMHLIKGTLCKSFRQNADDFKK
jgi:hypothetical protein